MSKVMNFTVVFFTRQYLTNGKHGEGAGQFRHSNDLKTEQILSALIDKKLIIGGDFIRNTRSKSGTFRYSSFRKQFPSVITSNPDIKEAFDVSRSRQQKKYSSDWNRTFICE